MDITVREAVVSDAAEVSRLILDLLGFVVADPSSREGEAFAATVTPAAVAERIAASGFRCWVAEAGGTLAGFIAVRDGSHLYHLFVDARCQRHGVARALWQQARASLPGRTFSVNALLSAVPVYERLGFVRAGPAQTSEGLSFMAMTCAV